MPCISLAATVRKSFEKIKPKSMPDTIAIKPMIKFSQKISLFSCFFEAPIIVINPNCLFLFFKKLVTEYPINIIEKRIDINCESARISPNALFESMIFKLGWNDSTENKKNINTENIQFRK